MLYYDTIFDRLVEELETAYDDANPFESRDANAC